MFREQVSQERSYGGRFASKDGPGYITDGRHPINEESLRQRARTAAELARRAGSPTPRLGLAALVARAFPRPRRRGHHH